MKIRHCFAMLKSSLSDLNMLSKVTNSLIVSVQLFKNAIGYGMNYWSYGDLILHDIFLVKFQAWFNNLFYHTLICPRFKTTTFQNKRLSSSSSDSSIKFRSEKMKTDMLNFLKPFLQERRSKKWKFLLKICFFTIGPDTLEDKIKWYGLY